MGRHYVKRIPRFSSPFFPPLTAVLAANVTNLVWSDHWGSIECVVMLIVTQWKATRLLRLYAPHLWPVPQFAACVCCACCIELADLHRPSSAVYPPSVCSPIKHMQTKHTHQMLACQYKDTRMAHCIPTHTCKQKHYVLSALRSKLRYLNVFLWIQDRCSATWH